MNNEQANKIMSRIQQEMKTCNPIALHDDEIAAIHAAVRDGGAAELLRELREMAERGGIHARRAFAIAQCAHKKSTHLYTTAQNRKFWGALCIKFAHIENIAEAITLGIPADRAFWGFDFITLNKAYREKIRAIMRANGLQCVSTASYSWRDYRGIGCDYAPRKQAIRFYTGQRINSDFSRCEYWQ